MPRRKIREYQTKSLINTHLQRVSGLDLQLKCVQISAEKEIGVVSQDKEWLKREKLVVKPDMLFGKRGKNGLVLLNASFEDAEKFVKERLGGEVTMGGLTGAVTHFIVEPFVPHQEEYYLSITCARDKNVLSFSSCGGMEIEENWDKIKALGLNVDESIDTVSLEPLFAGESLNDSTKAALSKFIQGVYKVFVDLNFHFIEFNPFTILANGTVFPLDARGEVDDCANFKNNNKWKVDGTPIDFPNTFGRKYCPEESVVRHLDEQTGASLKLTMLNPNGHIWGMIAGGGASVIYADTVADLGYGHDLGNYGEYSGDPNETETYQYACSLLSLATKNPDGKNKALLVGGAIANFTDVAATFSGIIRALREHAEQLVKNHVKVFVRRGGPNYQIGLKRMRDLGKDLGIPFEVYGPEVHMTKIVKLALEWINQGHHVQENGNGKVTHENGKVFENLHANGVGH